MSNLNVLEERLALTHVGVILIKVDLPGLSESRAYHVEAAVHDEAELRDGVC